MNVDHKFIELTRKHHEYHRNKLSAIGIYRGQPPLIMELSRNGQMTISEISKRLQISLPTVTKMVQRLEINDLVVKESG